MQMKKENLQQTIALRPVKVEDTIYLHKIYAQTRAKELKQTGWNEQQQELFTQQQFFAQTTDWAKNYKQDRFDIILWEKEPIGRFYVEEREKELRLVDIIVDVERQGKGVGGYLIRNLLKEATEKGKSVTLHVEANNWAKEYYKKLGFEVIKPHPVHSFLEWKLNTN